MSTNNKGNKGEGSDLCGELRIVTFNTKKSEDEMYIRLHGLSIRLVAMVMLTKLTVLNWRKEGSCICLVQGYSMQRYSCLLEEKHGSKLH